MRTPANGSTSSGTRILDGQEAAGILRRGAHADAERARERGVRPRLTVVRIGEHPVAEEQVAGLTRAADAWPVEIVEEQFAATVSPAAAKRRVRALARDPATHALLLVRPLPPTSNSRDLETEVPPEKDVEGVHPSAMGRALEGRPLLVPSLALALRTLVHAATDLEERRVVLLGSPGPALRLAALALGDAAAAVTLVRPDARDARAIASEADVLIAATGRPRSVGRQHVKQGALVIDTGVHAVAREGGRYRLVGDVDPAGVEGRAAARTAVPGGLEPVITAARLANAVCAAAGGAPTAGGEDLPLFGVRH